MPAQALACLDATPGDAGRDAPHTALPAAAGVVEGLVGVQLAGTPPRAATAARADGRDGIEGRGEYAAVVAVRSAQCDAERSAAGVRDQVSLRARLAAVGRVRADLRAPLFAGTLALSSANWKRRTSRASIQK